MNERGDDPFAITDAQGCTVRAGTMDNPAGSAPMTIIMGYRQLREAARDWRTFSSDAPGQIPILGAPCIRAPRLTVVEPVVFEPWIDLGFARIPHGIERLELALTRQR